MKTSNAVLTFASATKSYGVTIQMKPLQQYFCVVPFVFQFFYKVKNEVFLKSWYSWESKGKNK